MALIIKKSKNTFFVEGSINTNTAKNFENHFKSVLLDFKFLVINIEKVTDINIDGMKALRALCKSLMTSNKKLYLIGTSCKEVYSYIYGNK